MSAPAVAEAVTRRPGRRLRAVPHPADTPLTVTISIEGGAPGGRDRVLAALRDLVSAAGADAVSLLPADTPSPPAPAGPNGTITLEPKPRAAFRGGRLLDLSRLEFDLLLFFATHPRQVFSRSQLLAQVWGHVHTGPRTVDVHISRLRTKLGEPELLTTVYGVGYRLADDADVVVR
jgi:two-component system response regulator MtrA